MKKTLVVSLLCLLAGTACGSKDPDADKDAGGKAGTGSNQAGKGGSGEPDDGGTKPPPDDAAAGHGGSDDGGGGTGGAGDSGANAGTDAGDSGGPVEACADGPYMPMGVGFSWTYRVTDPVDGETEKMTLVEGMEAVGGEGPNADKTAYHVVTTKVSGGLTDTTESWQDVLEDNSVVRYREIGFKTGTAEINGEEHWDPYKLRFDQSDAHIVKGAEWNEQYTETKTDNGVGTPEQRNDGWVVDDVDVPCGPVHGEMLKCIQVRKTVDGASSGKTYWYARCIGKVREEGSQTEELIDYDVE